MSASPVLSLTKYGGRWNVVTTRYFETSTIKVLKSDYAQRHFLILQKLIIFDTGNISTKELP